jgi:hypothetical protein
MAIGKVKTKFPTITVTTKDGLFTASALGHKYTTFGMAGRTDEANMTMAAGMLGVKILNDIPEGYYLRLDAKGGQRKMRFKPVLVKSPY